MLAEPLEETGGVAGHDWAGIDHHQRLSAEGDLDGAAGGQRSRQRVMKWVQFFIATVEREIRGLSRAGARRT